MMNQSTGSFFYGESSMGRMQSVPPKGRASGLGYSVIEVVCHGDAKRSHQVGVTPQDKTALQRGKPGHVVVEFPADQHHRHRSHTRDQPRDPGHFPVCHRARDVHCFVQPLAGSTFWKAMKKAPSMALLMWGMGVSGVMPLCSLANYVGEQN